MLFRLSTIFLSFFLTLNLCADKKSQAWRSLSAKCQNLHQQLLLIEKTSAPEISKHRQAIESIENTLNLLVELGALREKKIIIKAPKEVGDDSFQKVLTSVKPISEDYGIFVASEMCGIGARLYFTVIKSVEPVELHVRLPEKELKVFEDTLLKLGLLANPEGTPK